MNNPALDPLDKELAKTYAQQGLTQSEAEEFVHLMNMTDLAPDQQERYNTLVAAMNGSRHQVDELLGGYGMAA